MRSQIEILTQLTRSNESQRFLYALKLQSANNLTINQKLVEILQRYFEIQLQLHKKTEEVQSITKYNKKLLQWISQFSEHEKKILDRMHKLQQINIKYMKQFCIMRNKDFNTEEYRPFQAIYGNFKIIQEQIAIQTGIKTKKMSLQQSYEQKLVKVFQGYILHHQLDLKESLIAKIKQIQETMQNNQRKRIVKKIQNILQRINIYNEDVKKVSVQNMFNLFLQKKDIYFESQLYLGKTSTKDDYLNKKQQRFADQVMVLHSKIEQFDKNQILKIVKNRRENDLKLHQMKIYQIQKYQEELERIICENSNYDCENKRLQRTNYQLSKELSQLKDLLKQREAELKLKCLKQTPIKINNSINAVNFSSTDQSSDQLKTLKYINKTLSQDLNQMREKYEEARQQFIQLKYNISSIPQQKEQSQNIIDIDLVEVPIPVPLFWTVQIPIDNKLIQLIRSKFLELGYDMSKLQDIQSLIFKLVQVIQVNQVNKTKIKNLQEAKVLQQDEHERLIKKNEQIRIQNQQITNQNKLLSNKIISIKQQNIQIEKRMLNINQEKQIIRKSYLKLQEEKQLTEGNISIVQKMMTQNAYETLKIYQQNQDLTEKNIKLQKIYIKNIERVNYLQKIICHIIDTLIRNSISQPEETVKNIQISLLYLKNMLKDFQLISNQQQQILNSSNNKKNPKNVIEQPHTNVNSEAKTLNNLNQDKIQVQSKFLNSQVRVVHEMIRNQRKQASEKHPNEISKVQYQQKKFSSLLNEQYMHKIESMFNDLKQKITKNNRDNYYEELMQLKLRYKEVLNSLQSAENINKQYNLSYQKFINELKQSGTTQNSKIEMERKIFNLQNHIKQLQGLLEQQKQEFQNQITQQIHQSQAISRTILENFCKNLQNQNNQG